MFLELKGMFWLGCLVGLHVKMDKERLECNGRCQEMGVGDKKKRMERACQKKEDRG